MELIETRKNVEVLLTEELKTEYSALTKQLFLIKSPLNEDEFDTKARKLLKTDAQIQAHNQFMLALLNKNTSQSLRDLSDQEQAAFEPPNYLDYLPISSPSTLPPNDLQPRYAASELFIPDRGFLANRIAFTIWENGLREANDKVTEVMLCACQTFVKNILTAMISRKKSYKVRDGKFQYGFNQPTPDVFLRNYNHITDETAELKVDVEEDSFIPKVRLSQQRMEQEAMFSGSMAFKDKKYNNALTVKLLYDTLRANPKILGLSAEHGAALLKLSLLVNK